MEIDIQFLYNLQDQVMKILFECEKIFYLTGGTCLNRFYYEKRLSEDLDFFTNQNPRFHFALKNIKNELQKKLNVKTVVETKNFHRYIINEILQVDFINDISYRDGDIVLTKDGFLIDNIFNILTNKITAIISRDDPKDVFDLYTISKYNSFSWSDVLISSHKKLDFTDEELVIRLKTFPYELLDSLKIIDKNFLNNFPKEFPLLIQEIYYHEFHYSFDKKSRK